MASTRLLCVEGKSHLLRALVLGVALCTGGVAHAVEVSTPAEDDAAPTLNLNGWAQAGFFGSDAGGSETYGTYLGMARLAGRAEWGDDGAAFVQVAADDGNLALLDVIAEVSLGRWLTWRTGKFRVPNSIDVLIAAPFTPYVNRANLVGRGFVPRRHVGTELQFSSGGEGWNLDLHAGVFEPARDVGGIAPTKFANFRALLSGSGGLSAHLAFAPGAPFVQSAIGAAPASFQQTGYSDVLDAGFIYSKDGWSGFLEYALPTQGGGDDFAAYATLLKNLPIEGSTHSWEPGFKYEYLRQGGSIEHHTTSGINYYWHGDELNASLNVDNEWSGEVDTTLYLQLQAGF